MLSFMPFFIYIYFNVTWKVNKYNSSTVRMILSLCFYFVFLILFFPLLKVCNFGEIYVQLQLNNKMGL